MKVCLILCSLLASAPLTFAQQAPRVNYSPMRDAPEVREETRTQLLSWLTDFQNTVFRMRIHEFLAAVNWREIVLSGYPPATEPLPEEKVTKFAKGMELLCERMLPQIKSFFLFDRVDVRRIDLNGDAATIVGRCHDTDDTEFKARWSLRRLDGRWQLVDFENATVSMRLSGLMAQALQIQPDAPAQAKEVAGKFIQIGIATENGDAKTALRLANELLTIKLPVSLREMVLLIKADLQIAGEEEIEAALAELEKAGSTNPAFFLLKASRFHQKEMFKECIEWASKYGKAIGHDGDSWQMLNECHRELGQKAEALQTAKDWLADYPHSATAMYAYWQALPETQQVDALRPLLNALPAATENFDGFDEFGSAAYDKDDAAALKLLIEVMKARKMPKEDIEVWESTLEEILPPESEKAKNPETAKKQQE